ncbi:hypothetical protein [Geodermatophilus sp. SYSU D01036]
MRVLGAEAGFAAVDVLLIEGFGFWRFHPLQPRPLLPKPAIALR